MLKNMLSLVGFFFFQFKKVLSQWLREVAKILVHYQHLCTKPCFVDMCPRADTLSIVVEIGNGGKWCFQQSISITETKCELKPLLATHQDNFIRKCMFYQNMSIPLPYLCYLAYLCSYLEGCAMTVSVRQCFWRILQKKIFTSAQVVVNGLKKVFLKDIFHLFTPFKCHFAPISRSPMSKFFRFSESSGKMNGNKWSQIWTLLLKRV